MDEIIRVRNSSYDRYEKLLMRRDELRKEASLINMNYIKEFGSLILDVFRKKMECIKKKKSIAFYQAALNRGEAMDPEALKKYLELEMASYQEQLEAMAEENRRANEMKMITELEVLEIKKLYRKLAKQLHPDINPMTAENPDLNTLWNRIVMAYDCNSLKDLKELEVLAGKALEQMGCGIIEIDIPDIELKMEEVEAEIANILETDPYQYRYILEDPERKAQKKADLQGELDRYTDYEAELDAALEKMMLDGGGIVWRLN